MASEKIRFENVCLTVQTRYGGAAKILLLKQDSNTKVLFREQSKLLYETKKLRKSEENRKKIRKNP